MTYYDLIKKYGAGKGEQAMWASTKRVSDYLTSLKDTNPKEYWKLLKATYADMCGKHFDEHFAKWQIEQMYYTDKEGRKHYAPYWNDDDMKKVYEANKSKLETNAYNMWDFAVTMNMIKSDNCILLHKWFPNASDDEMLSRLIDLSVNWLNDKDNPFGDGVKVWCYFNHE